MRGLLLLNLGTPDAPTTAAVRRYLRQFLSDPRVLDINPVARALLLNLIILPFRSPKSAHAYRTIWDPARGSPLLYHTQDLARQVQARLGETWRIELGMRYGKPSIAHALARLVDAGCRDISVLPLFPQYASSSTGTAYQEVMAQASTMWNVPPLTLIPAFYDHPDFLAAFADVGAAPLASFRPDHVLFSFHGLPERHIIKSDPGRNHCLAMDSCCDAIGEANRDCYRAQSFATARGIAERLALTPDRYSISFQSRLGRTPWIKPYTDARLDELAASGCKRLLVFCPAFVADCLETLEEIALRAREQFIARGGEELQLVPSLNSAPAWVDAVVNIGTNRGPGASR
ncbi:MAG: ferrochelatase [Myxococcales bacterium]|nr:ferrochelatase [Myxococcales bacterium]